MPKKTFIVKNRITLQVAILGCSGATIQCPPLSKIHPQNTGGRVPLLVKLKVDCSK